MRFQAGGNREGLNFQQIRLMIIPIPPVNEQKNVCEILSAQQKLITSLGKNNSKNRILKKSLMQDLLTGKVRVKVN